MGTFIYLILSLARCTAHFYYFFTEIRSKWVNVLLSLARLEAYWRTQNVRWISSGELGIRSNGNRSNFQHVSRFDILQWPLTSHLQICKTFLHLRSNLRELRATSFLRVPPPYNRPHRNQVLGKRKTQLIWWQNTMLKWRSWSKRSWSLGFPLSSCMFAHDPRPIMRTDCYTTVSVKNHIQRVLALLWQKNLRSVLTPLVRTQIVDCIWSLTYTLDGTTNFIHGFPFACISLGLVYKRRPVLGVIFNPFLDHLVSLTQEPLNTFLNTTVVHRYQRPGFILDKGCKCQSIKTPFIESSKTIALSESSFDRYGFLSGVSLSLTQVHSLAVEWGSDRNQTTINAKSNSFSRLAGDPGKGVLGGKMAHSLRSMGSAALNYAMVAQGGLDLYWFVCFLVDKCFQNNEFLCAGRSVVGRGMFVRGSLLQRKLEVSSPARMQRLKHRWKRTSESWPKKYLQDANISLSARLVTPRYGMPLDWHITLLTEFLGWERDRGSEENHQRVLQYRRRCRA